VQLENLGLWHASLLTELRKFKVHGQPHICWLLGLPFHMLLASASTCLPACCPFPTLHHLVYHQSYNARLHAQGVTQ
jgi:hypothetical protein